VLIKFIVETDKSNSTSESETKEMVITVSVCRNWKLFIKGIQMLVARGAHAAAKIGSFGPYRNCIFLL